MTHSSLNEYGQLMNIQQVAEVLHGKNFTQTDVHRLYRMVKNEQLDSVKMGRRWFVPVWAVEKLCKKKNFWESQRVVKNDNESGKFTSEVNRSN